MNTPDSRKIVMRFFKVVRALKSSDQLRYFSDFTAKYEIRDSTFRQAELNPSSNRFQLAWIYYLAREFGVSTE